MYTIKDWNEVVKSYKYGFDLSNIFLSGNRFSPNVAKINFEFRKLKNYARTKKSWNDVDRIHRYSLLLANGKMNEFDYLNKLRKIARNNNLDTSLIDNFKHHVSVKNNKKLTVPTFKLPIRNLFDNKNRLAPKKISFKNNLFNRAPSNYLKEMSGSMNNFVRRTNKRGRK